jgi:hypothetical protein
MKPSILLIASATLFSSGAAFGQARDKGSEPERDDSDRGPGGTRLAFDVDYANRFDTDDSGFGGAVRFGREYDVVLLSLTPEFMANLNQFSGPGSPTEFAGMAGGRATIGKIIEPGVFAHVGVGHVSQPDSLTGLGFDLGLTVDLTLIPAVDLGVHGAYDSVGWGDETFDWYRLGAHLAFAP